VRENLGADPDRQYDERLRRELVERKFTVAGHSARWMFDMTESDVLEEIWQLLRCVDDVVMLFYRNAFDLNVQASNNLLTQDPTYGNYGQRLLLTSDAVARAVARIVSPSLAGEMYLMLNRYEDSVIMEEHVVRIDFEASVRTHQLSGRVQYVAELDPDTNPQATMLRPDASPQEAKLSRRVFETDFDNTFSSRNHAVIEFHRDVLTEESTGMHLPGTWFVPRVYNLGGFDCVQLLERGGVPTLRFVHVTVKVQQDHPIRRDCMHTFLLSLNEFRAKVQPHPEPPITAMEVVVMLPHDVALDATPPSEWDVAEEQSTIGTTSGSGSGGGAGPKIAVTRRVAGCKLTSRTP
jgi:hypothetical protein